MLPQKHACNGERLHALGARRFLTRLLLVHGSLSAYRLSRLIKYSFYKNIAFGFLLFYYQARPLLWLLVCLPSYGTP